jgi:hypothetical protein
MDTTNVAGSRDTIQGYSVSHDIKLRIEKYILCIHCTKKSFEDSGLNNGRCEPKVLCS